MSSSRKILESSKPFAALEPRASHVSKAAVKRKWKKLPTASQENVRDIITSARRQSTTVKRKGSKAAFDSNIFIDEVADRLNERLPRMPFPPATSDEVFDFEFTLHRIQSLEQQLTDNQHSVNLLRAQIKKEEHQLRMDKQEVESLQESIKSNNAVRRRQSKNLHTISQLSPESVAQRRHPIPPSISSVKSEHSSLQVSMLSKDATLSPMIQQLRDHLASMQSNTSNIQAIVTCMQDIGYRLHTSLSRHSVKQ